MRSLLDDKKGGLMDLPINLLMLFIVITFLVALIPGLTEIIGNAQQSNSLNCNGYWVDGDANNPLSYNATLADGGHTNTIACMAIKLYVPYIVLGVLIAGVALIFYGRGAGGGAGDSQYYG